MPVWWTRWAEVVRAAAAADGLQELVVRLDGSEVPAVNYPALTGPVAVGDRVLVNVAAVELGLGSGGFHLVAAVAGREELRGGRGRTVKLRYTPWQIVLEAAEESGGDAGRPAGETAAESGGEAGGPAPEPLLDGMPVVVGEVHSQLVPLVAGLRGGAARPPRVAYVHTDGGALPAWWSRRARELREAGWLAAVITAGHAFGGDLEAVSLPSALALARRRVQADAAVVVMGPGIAGTGTSLGFTGVEQAWALDAAAALGGRPVACARLSGADPRPRHRLLSHHSAVILGRLVRSCCLLPLPRLPGEAGCALRRRVEEAGLAARHAVVWVSAAPLRRLLREVPFPLEHMGRGMAEDEPFFLAAAAAGWLAGSLAVAVPPRAGAL